jgi:hypothetical protein
LFKVCDRHNTLFFPALEKSLQISSRGLIHFVFPHSQPCSSQNFSFELRSRAVGSAIEALQLIHP